MDLTLTIRHIYPNLTDKDFVVIDKNTWDWPFIIWYNKEIEQPTQLELETAWRELENIKISNQYKEDRKKEYLSIWEQLDQLYWDKINWTNIWQETITEIKNKYPKS